MSFTRRDLLLSGAAAGLLGPDFALAGRRKNSHKRMIIVFADGGWDTTFCMDPKLGNSEIEGPEIYEDPAIEDDVEAVQTFSGIPIVVNDYKRPNVTTFFDKWASKTAVINGVWMGAIAHKPCRIRMLTGTTSNTNPDLTVITGYKLGRDLPLGSVDTSGLSYSGYLAASSGRIGKRSQIKMLMDPQSTFDGTPPLFQPGQYDEAAMQELLASRTDRFEGLRPGNDQMFSNLRESRERAARFIEGGTEIAEQLNLGNPPVFILECMLGLDLLRLEQCQAVMLNSSGVWDTHQANYPQHDYYNTLFNGLDLLAEELDADGLLDETLVVVMSEMTRTPKYNVTSGKDHWPHTSTMMFGGGVKGGVVLGGTDDLLESKLVDFETGVVNDKGDLLKYDNLAAGILEMMDIDSAEFLPGVKAFRGAMG